MKSLTDSYVSEDKSSSKQRQGLNKTKRIIKAAKKVAVKKGKSFKSQATQFYKEGKE